MVITFTLQAAYSGATYVAGPFNISGTTNTGTVTELATGLTKTQLLTGYTISNINDATTGGTINSTGTCTSSVPWLANPELEPSPATYDCFNGNCIEAEGLTGTYPSLSACEADCSAPPSSYFCKESELAPCIEQASPCQGSQIQCGEYLAPE
jgi:hypothetical protein